MIAHMTVTALISKVSRQTSVVLIIYIVRHSEPAIRVAAGAKYSPTLVTHHPSHLKGASGCRTELMSGRAKGVGGVPASNSHMEENIRGPALEWNSFFNCATGVGISHRVKFSPA